MARVCIMLAGLADVYGYEKKRYRKRKEQNYSNFGALLDQFWSNFGPSWPNLPHLGAILGAFLGQLGAILGSLGPSWPILDLLGTKSFLEPRVQNFPAPGFADLRDFGVQFGAQNWLLFGYFWRNVLDQFLDTFWITFWPILELLFGTRWA